MGDWQLSQFWYTDATADALATAVAAAVANVERPRIACVSAPTLYRALKRLDKPNMRAEVFEYDNRFAAYGSDFHFFDYKAPLEVDRSLREQFDLVFADPPFLSDECLTKTAVTISACLLVLPDSGGLEKVVFFPPINKMRIIGFTKN